MGGTNLVLPNGKFPGENGMSELEMCVPFAFIDQFQALRQF